MMTLYDVELRHDLGMAVILICKAYFKKRLYKQEIQNLS